MRGHRPTGKGGPGNPGTQPSQQDLQALVALYSAGQLREAERKAKALLKRFPGALFALNVLGATLAGQGKLSDAAAAHKRVLKLKPDYAEGHYNLGVVLQQSGRLEHAADSYKKAVTLKPIAEAYGNLGVVQQQLGQLGDAVASYKQAVALKADHGEAHNNLGNALKELGQLDAAIESYRNCLAVSPDSAEAHYNLGGALEMANRPEEAVDSYRQALQLNPDHAVAHSNLGMVLVKLDRGEEAIASIRRALEIDPEFAGAYNDLGNVYAAHGDQQRALENFRKAEEMEPDRSDVHNNIAVSLHKLGRADEAEASFLRALEIRPDYVEACGHLCEHYEKTNQLDRAREFTQESLKRFPDDPFITFCQAVLLRRQGKIEEAKVLLEPMANAERGAFSEALFGKIHTELGMVYDRLKDSENAFHHFTAGNESATRSFIARQFSKEKFLSNVSLYTEMLNADWVRSWAPLSDGPHGEKLAFLVGFPRSGTTLLDQILDSHPAIQVMEEQSVLANMIPKTARSLDEYPGALAELDESQAQALREAYLEGVARHLEREDNMLLVDKMPLNICQMALVARLFPKAKVILAMRHPCDVVLSNFMQQFAINEAMANFFNLPDTAHCYAQVMGLWRKSIDLLAVPYHTVKYESLVDDFEQEVRALLTFLELDWDDAVLDYGSHAMAKAVINTPSYQDVTEPINARARYRWKRYEDKLAPVMRDLEPFIAAFGYGDG